MNKLIRTSDICAYRWGKNSAYSFSNIGVLSTCLVLVLLVGDSNPMKETETFCFVQRNNDFLGENEINPLHWVCDCDGIHNIVRINKTITISMSASGYADGLPTKSVWLVVSLSFNKISCVVQQMVGFIRNMFLVHKAKSVRGLEPTYLSIQWSM